MTPMEEKLIIKLNNELTEKIQITLILAGDEQNKAIINFCETLKSLAPKITVIKKKDVENRHSTIQLNNNLAYQAVPLGTELEPFLTALAFLGGKPIQLPESVQKNIEEISLPAMLTIFVTQHCPFCPKTVSQLVPLAFLNKFIKLTVIDGTLFPEMAQQHDIRSAPTVLLEDSFRWTGATQLDEIIEILKNRDPSKLSASTLENMLNEGNASGVADLMLKNDKLFPGFIDLLTHEKWPVRLGAMVAIEQIKEENSNLAAQCVEPLWKRFSDLEDQVKGDIIYILGETGNADTIFKIEKILKNPYHSEVKEAAEDAISSIKQRL